MAKQENNPEPRVWPQEATDRTFFTSDHHFYHGGIIRLSNRPFADVDEMNEALVQGWNSVVPEDGIVYNLGDVSWGNIPGTAELLSRLNGKIFFIRGNHDKVAMHERVLGRFERVRHLDTWTRVRDVKRLCFEDGGVKQDVILCHYPMGSYEKMRHGAWHLFGHCHGNFRNPVARSMDVGVDCHGYKPVSYAQVKKRMLATPLPDFYGVED